MAKLDYYYGLCPLIDQNSLLGVCEDVESGCAIVTLGPNIAIKYRLSDQKQLHSWRTKDKFSSPVIFDFDTQKYVGAFNQSYLRVWNGDEEYLDKLKKFKFKKQIHTLATCEKKSFVVFKDGEIVTLSLAMDERKTYVDNNVVSCNLVTLTASLNNQTCIGVLSKSEDNVLFVGNIFNGSEKQLVKIELPRERDGAVLMGQVLTQLDDKNVIYILTLWSDGKLFSYPVSTPNESIVKSEPPGDMIALIESVSCKHHVTMTSLSSHYVAMYGGNIKEEGATLILYNTQFKVAQVRQALKLFTEESQLWKIENNLLFCMGLNLAVVSFHLDTELLSTLVGSHCSNVTDSNIVVIEEMTIGNWKNDESCDLDYQSIPSRIKKQVLQFSNEGFCESLMCEKIINQYIESDGLKAINACMNYFCDIPEHTLAKLLKFALTVDASTEDQSRLLDKILLCSFSDILLIPFIRSELDLNASLELLEYITYLLSEDAHVLSAEGLVNPEKKLVDWGCLILDANYQNFLLSRDQKVVEIINKFNVVVSDNLKSLKTLEEVYPMLSCSIGKGKLWQSNKKVQNVNYQIIQEFLF